MLALPTGKARRVHMIVARVPGWAEDVAAGAPVKPESVATRVVKMINVLPVKLLALFRCFRPFHYL